MSCRPTRADLDLEHSRRITSEQFPGRCESEHVTKKVIPPDEVRRCERPVGHPGPHFGRTLSWDDPPLAKVSSDCLMCGHPREAHHDARAGSGCRATVHVVQSVTGRTTTQHFSYPCSCAMFTEATT